MKAKLKLTLIWTFTTMLMVCVFIQLVEINDKQKQLNKLKARESSLDEEITQKLIDLNEINTE